MDEDRARFEKRERYLAEFGRFVSLFALAEAMLKNALRHIVGVDERTALAVFSGVRAAEGSTLIRRCFEARKNALPEELNKLLVQFSTLSNLRNNLVHYGIDLSATPPITTNRSYVLSDMAIREMHIEEHTLSDATIDCAKIILGLSCFVEDGKDDGRLAFSVRDPWQYKPSAQANKDRGRRKRKPHPR
ncbi:MAG: hypothetical protein ACRED9_01295 [Caulobacteraceae bacterium]